MSEVEMISCKLSSASFLKYLVLRTVPKWLYSVVLAPFCAAVKPAVQKMTLVATRIAVNTEKMFGLPEP